jgi:type VI secretion system protein ImpG
MKFEIRFEFARLPFSPPRLKPENFVLSAVPAINVFPHDGDPIRLDHRKSEYIVRPSGAKASHFQVYAVEKVTGIVHGSAQQREYKPFDVYAPSGQASPVYRTAVQESSLAAAQDVYLSVAYPPEMGPPVSETLSLSLLCTNGSLPESLQKGDVSLPTTGSPEFADFVNIRRPTANVLPPVGSGKNLLWRLLSHLSLNYVSLATARNLRAVLDLFIFQETRDRTAVISNKRRITGIEDVTLRPANRLVSGIMMRGQQVRLKLRQDHFAGPGDLYLFGSVLDYFLGVYASLNTYTQLFVDESLKGETYQWPVRTGDRHLI